MDMVGIQTVFGLMPGAEIHLLWKSTELVEGFPNWWTRPTTTFADCPTHPPFGTGTAKGAGPELVDRFEGLMANMVSQYREGATKALQA
jgi:hypothetical protein